MKSLRFTTLAVTLTVAWMALIGCGDSGNENNDDPDTPDVPPAEEVAFAKGADVGWASEMEYA